MKISKFDKDGRDLICPECGSGARLTDGREVYGKPGYGLLWVCEHFPKCDCRVGCHKGTTTPLGELCNEKTRLWRRMVHEKLDPLWKTGKYNRSELYEDLGIKMNIIPYHTADLNIEQCKKVLEFLNKHYYGKTLRDKESNHPDN